MRENLIEIDLERAFMKCFFIMTLTATYREF